MDEVIVTVESAPIIASFDDGPAVLIEDTEVVLATLGAQGPPGPPGTPGTTDHALLANLDYAHANHTGFAGTGVANTFLAGQTISLSGSGAVTALSIPCLPNTGNFPALTWFRSGDTTQAAFVEAFTGSGTSASAMNLILGVASSGGSPAASLSVGSRFQQSQFNSSLTIVGQRTTDVTITGKAASAQTADLLRLTDSVGNVLVSASVSGVLTSTIVSCGEVDCSGAVNANSFASSGFFVTVGGDLQSNSVTTGDLAANNITANTVTADGSGLANLNASNIATGTLGDGRLSSNVPLKNAANTFTTGTQTIQTGAAGTRGLVVKGAVSQSANLTEWQDSTGNKKTYIDGTGALTTVNNVPIQFTNTGGTVGDYIHLDNANNFACRNNAGSGNAFYGVNSGGGSCIFQTAGVNRTTLDTNGTTTMTGVSSAVRLIPKGAAGQTGNLTEWQDSSGNPLSTVSENGYFTTRKNAAPADAELSTGEAAFWFDSTAGAAKLMVKAKNASGTVVTGSIPLS